MVQNRLDQQYPVRSLVNETHSEQQTSRRLEDGDLTTRECTHCDLHFYVEPRIACGPGKSSGDGLRSPNYLN